MSWPVSVVWKFAEPTGICSINFFRTEPIIARMPMAARWKIAASQQVADAVIAVWGARCVGMHQLRAMSTYGRSSPVAFRICGS